MAILLGAIADDFTGATDLANTLVKAGMRTTQLIGAPDADFAPDDAEAVVIALKSRTTPAADAVLESLAALAWLQDRGALQMIFKYCSTFDSTAEGNIGPVADALLDGLGADFAVVCPAFPENGRTIYMGHLFVGSDPIDESPMKDHPLTPMRDSSLLRLMGAQTPRKVGSIDHRSVRAGVDAVRARVAELRAEGIAYGVADAICDEDLLTIGRAAADHQLVTGGSGVAMALPENLREAGLLSAGEPPAPPRTHGRDLVLAGSCSAATRAQIARFGADHPALKLDAHAIAAGEDVAGAACDWAEAQPASAPVLIYGSADPAEVAAIQARYGKAEAGAMMEAALASIAVRLAERGFDRLVLAGGETSGAIVSALGVTGLRIGPEIDPGVPWTESVGERPLALALKSGNFGGEDFFTRALGMLA